MISALVKQYEQDGKEFKDWVYDPKDFESIYRAAMILTENDHEIAQDAASWCELATVGEIYEFREGEIEIVDID